MKLAATSRMVRLKKLLETELPSAALLDALALAASEELVESEPDSVVPVLLASLEEVVVVALALWKRMWCELDAVG